jgi:hypothetical protein
MNDRAWYRQSTAKSAVKAPSKAVFSKKAWNKPHIRKPAKETEIEAGQMQTIGKFNTKSIFVLSVLHSVAASQCCLL